MQGGDAGQQGEGGPGPSSLPAPQQDPGQRSRLPLSGLGALLLFAAVSLWARSGFRYFPAVPVSWQAWLGRPPPLAWIHVFLVIYLFSALLLSLTRLAAGHHPFTGFRHLAYLTAFYGFYAVSGGLEDNFWAVFVGGLSVLGLEGYRAWSQEPGEG